MAFTAIALIVVVAIAAVMDVVRRRIPNALTFPAIGAGILIGALTDGWWGGVTAVAGALLAPGVLMAVRLGKRIGMGDVKLAAAVGSLVGPAAGALAMLFAAVAGGLLAIVWMLRGRRFSQARRDHAPSARITLPYGVAIAVGSLLAIAVTGTG